MFVTLAAQSQRVFKDMNPKDLTKPVTGNPFWSHVGRGVLFLILAVGVPLWLGFAFAPEFGVVAAAAISAVVSVLLWHNQQRHPMG